MSFSGTANLAFVEDKIKSLSVPSDRGGLNGLPKVSIFCPFG